MRSILVSLCLLAFAFCSVERTQAAASDYKIQAEDVIKIIVFDEPMLTLETRVHGSGTITYPLLKDVKVAGKTAREVQNNIRDLLAKDYLVDPQVTINILEYSEQTFSVMGQVRVPMAYPLPPEKEIDIVQAIARAGGLTPNAKKGSIELYRNGKKTKYSYDDLLLQNQRSKDPKKRIFVQPGDVIKVPERFF